MPQEEGQDWRAWLAAGLAQGAWTAHQVYQDNKKAKKEAEKQAAEDRLRQNAILKAGRLEGVWISPESKLECEISRPDLVAPSIQLKVSDSLSRLRAVAVIHLAPRYGGEVRLDLPFKFVARTSTDLNVDKIGTELRGAMAIGEEEQSFTLSLYQPVASDAEKRKEALLAKFAPKVRPAIA